MFEALESTPGLTLHPSLALTGYVALAMKPSSFLQLL